MRGRSPGRVYRVAPVVRASGRKHSSIGLISAGKVFSWLRRRPGSGAAARRSSRTCLAQCLDTHRSAEDLRGRRDQAGCSRTLLPQDLLSCEGQNKPVSRHFPVSKFIFPPSVSFNKCHMVACCFQKQNKTDLAVVSRKILSKIFSCVFPNV